jgi:hypothetical protein
MRLLPFLLACTGSADDTAEAETPTISFLAPEDGATVPAGDIDVSLVVDDFTLEDPAKHNEGQPEGYVELSWTDGTTSDEEQTADTNTVISITSPGAWTLTASLYFADGDEVTEEFADFEPASVSITVE